MATQDNNKTYTAADFQQYHSGEMRGSAMRALEKAALEDPFLSDALDGYSETTNAENDLADLQNRLAAKSTKRNFFALPTVSSIWLRAAAIFILIGGVGLITYRINDNKKNVNNLAQVEQKNTRPSTTQSVIQTPGKTGSAVSSDQLNLTEQNTDAVALAKQNDATGAAGIASKNMATPITEQSTAAYDKMITSNNNIDQHQRKGAYNSNTDNNALQNAVLNSPVSSPAPAQVKDDLPTADSILGYASTEQRNKNSNEAMVAADRKDDYKKESIRVESERSKAKASDVSLNGKAAGVTVTNNAVPVIGMEKYRQYLADGIKHFRSPGNEIKHGEVVLSFAINKNGTPEHISVQKKLCDACDAEAMRLLKEGSKWQYTNNRENLLTIIF